MLSVATQTKYPIDAFLFVQRGLEFTVERLHGKSKPQRKPRRRPPGAIPVREDARDESEGSRHVTGKQLCHGLRDFAIQQYGLMAHAVLRRWRITSSEDFGQIVFALVKAQMMRKTEGDRIEDFADVFDFAAAFTPQLLLSDNV